MMESFVANQYVSTCETIYIVDPDQQISTYPSSTKFYVDGIVDKNYDDSYKNGILDEAEKRSFVTTNASGSSEGYKGIRKGWLASDTSVEVEIGEMQHSGQWAAYKPGSLVPYKNHS